MTCILWPSRESVEVSLVFPIVLPHFRAEANGVGGVHIASGNTKVVC